MTDGADETPRAAAAAVRRARAALQAHGAAAVFGPGTPVPAAARAVLDLLAPGDPG